MQKIHRTTRSRINHSIAIIMAFFCIVYGTQTMAEEKPELFVVGNVNWLGIGKSTEFSFATLDQVSDGCWTNSKAVENAVKLEFSRSGYSPTAAGLSTRQVVINIVGFAVENTSNCVYSHKFTVEFSDSDKIALNDHTIKGWGNRILFSRSGVSIMGKKIVNEKIKLLAVEAAQEFLLKVPEKQLFLREQLLISARTYPKVEAFWEQYSPN